MSVEAVEHLKQTFTGDVILPEYAAYDEARTTMMRRGSPAFILKPRTTQDVVAAVAFARAVGGPLSVRSGGHSGPGFSTNNGGTVIDIRHLHAIEVLDAGTGLVRIGAGATWGNAARELGQHGLALSSGDTVSVGVGGLTLGGGIGWMVREYGLTIDNLVAAEIVTADGSVLQVSKTEHADLFWGLRGAGSIFGVVTHFDFIARPITDVVSGTITYNFNDLPAVVTGWRDAMRAASNKLTSMLIVFPGFSPEIPPAATIMVCYAGADEAEAMQAIQPLQELAVPVQQDIKLMAYADVLQEAHPPEGKHVEAKNVFVHTMTDELINDIVATYKTEGPKPILQIRSLGGAMNQVPAEATAFAHRDSEILLVGAMFFPGDATPGAIEEGLRPWHALAAAGNGMYANLLSSATEHDMAQAYPKETHNRLAALKKTYDPQNLFNQNFNIAPQ